MTGSPVFYSARRGELRVVVATCSRAGNKSGGGAFDRRGDEHVGTDTPFDLVALPQAVASLLLAATGSTLALFAATSTASAALSLLLFETAATPPRLPPTPPSPYTSCLSPALTTPEFCPSTPTSVPPHPTPSPSLGFSISTSSSLRTTGSSSTFSPSSVSYIFS